MLLYRYCRCLILGSMKMYHAESGIAGSFLMPHPPVLVGAVGNGRESEALQTLRACERVAAKIAELKPDTIIVISPHAPLFSDYLYVYGNNTLSGSFARFGADSVTFSFSRDTELLDRFVELLRSEGIPGGFLPGNGTARFDLNDEVDHGVLVPLYFVRDAYRNFSLAALSCSAFPPERVFRCGQLLARAAATAGKRYCIIASGDMSHKVSRESPYGMVPSGAKFDQFIASALSASCPGRILEVDPDIRSEAAECGYNSLVFLSGALDPEASGIHAVSGLRSSLYSYEAPFGIGYCVAEIARESPPVRIARAAIESYVRTGSVPDSEELPSFDGESGGCFVSLHLNGELRGCIGTIAATAQDIRSEILGNAIAACSRDPRFDPVQEEELEQLEISVDILDKAEPVVSNKSLDPAEFGVIVTSGFKRGLLLPGLDGVDTVDEQLAIACRKAGIDQSAPYSIERFSVTRYT